jgi:putative ABC transport system permease protein
MRDWLSGLSLDFRFAARAFAKRPGFAAIAAITLALGIGATTAVFSIVDAVLLRPLPYKDPGRLAAIWITSTREKGLAKLFATHADYAEFQRSSRTLESVGAATWARVASPVLTGYGPARQVFAIPATASFFRTLGVPAALGRTFLPEDETGGCSILLANSFWTSIGADRGIVGGRSLMLDQKPCTVVGVMPERFSFYPRQTQAWILLGPRFQPRQDQMLVGIFARLKPGVTRAQAETELRSLFRAIHPGVDQQDFEPVVYDLNGEFTFLAGRTLRTTLILLFAAVLLVLLTACLNVANLLLGRVSDRRNELAVRAALGSGQFRLIRQVLAEGLLLSAAGTALGVALAGAAVRSFRHADPIELSVGADVRLNLPVLACGIALSIATTLIFALLPAIRASNVDLAQHLKAAGRGSVRGRLRLAKTVVAVEMALSFLLLIGAGLFLTSALRMGGEPLGFNPDHVTAARLGLPGTRYPGDAQRRRAFDELLDRLQGLPNAAGVALASRVPPEAGGNLTLEIQGRPIATGREIHDVGADVVTPGFFDLLNVPLLRGRAFRPQDGENSLPVAIVNQALAEEYFPGVDPMGQQIRLPGGAMPWLTVVGVVGNLKHTELMNEMAWVETPIFYRPLAQEPRPSVEIVMRARGDLGSIVPEAQRAVAGFDPSIPFGDAEPLRSRVGRVLAYPRFRAAVFAFFAVGALLLSAVGLYGVLSQLVAQRIPEFGLRRAVGAQTRDLLLLVARQGGIPVLAGLAAGIWLTTGISRLLASLLYGIRPADPEAFAVAALILLAVACIAIVRPAARAARVDPMAALRDE